MKCFDVLFSFKHVLLNFRVCLRTTIQQQKDLISVSDIVAYWMERTDNSNTSCNRMQRYIIWNFITAQMDLLYASFSLNLKEL
jgi:hypothetical protein